MLEHAQDCIAKCRALALHTEEPGRTTRTFLSAPMHAVHHDLTAWMQQAGMSVKVDSAGNLRGRYEALGPTLYIGSHLDTVPNAGAFDGILGVVIGIKLVELLNGRKLPFAIEVIGFSEEEGVRFGFPFIGSLAFIGDREPLSRSGVSDAVRAFGLNPDDVPDEAERSSLGYLEFHIEQGPVLENLNRPLGIVHAIAGQSRWAVTFEGQAGHAGTTPMPLRHDALCGAAEWIAAVEREAIETPGAVATVGKIEALPGAANIIPAKVAMTLDVRHREDSSRHEIVDRLLAAAEQIAARRNLRVTSESRLNQAAVAMDPVMSGKLARAAERSGNAPHVMDSGAGHDAMIVARRMPTAMLFLRSPGGLSHHPDESVLPEDVAAALAAGMEFLA